MRIGWSPSSILVLIAVGLFVLAALDVRVGSLALVPLGLATLSASFLFRKGLFGL